MEFYTESYGLVVKVTPMLPYNFGPPRFAHSITINYNTSIMLNCVFYIETFRSYLFSHVGASSNFGTREEEVRGLLIIGEGACPPPVHQLWFWGRVRLFIIIAHEGWHFNTESYGLVVKVTPMLPYNFGPPPRTDRSVYILTVP